MLNLCRQFSCLPSQLLAEDAELIRLLAIEEQGSPPEEAEPEV